MLDRDLRATEIHRHHRLLSKSARLFLLPVFLTCSIGWVGCSSTTDQEVEFAPLPPVPPTVAPPPVGEGAGETTRRAQRREPLVPAVVEIDPDGNDSADTVSLVQAADAERRRRSQISTEESAPVAGERKATTVITNQNLEEFASQGELTFVEEEAGAANEVPPELQRARTRSAAEDYWRDQALRVRLDLKGLDDERTELEARAAELRRSFYNEDDAYRRDGIVKPEWDRVLERLSDVRQELRSGRLDLERLYEEASSAGADPSWLDEGLELTPEAAYSQDGEDEEQRDDRLPALEAIDPPSMETESTDPS